MGSAQCLWCHFKNLLLAAPPPPLLPFTPPCEGWGGVAGVSYKKPLLSGAPAGGSCHLSQHWHNPVTAVLLDSARGFTCLDIPALSSLNTHLLSKSTSKFPICCVFPDSAPKQRPPIHRSPAACHTNLDRYSLLADS